MVLLLPTAYAGLIGAPYAPTFSQTIQQAFTWIKLGKGDLLVDLGAGDGRTLLAAARRGARALGYELSPIMWLIAWLRAKALPNTKVRLANFYRQQLPNDTTVVFVFLMPKIMPRVRQYLANQRLLQCRAVLVYAFPFPDLTPQHVIREKGRLPLYSYNYAQLTDAVPHDTN